ncbi:APC family permease [Arthrobacter sp. I2-34]|uniref:APC family permease n=1 Tax=Arthrobacter hankyongi TaxID=2904801 RepID=A0ABS9L774_9MICC|nr:APC family permease [Arthrobacter hankyongi]MCG2622519.1 APC family permease [Arthrobacter hankyongi]
MSSINTRYMDEQQGKLHRTLGRLDIVLLTIAAVISIEILGQISSYGGETFTWLVVLTVTFLLPYALLFAETGSTFTEEGGCYNWVKRAFGRGVASVATVFYWVTTPVWIGGSMALLAGETFNHYLLPLDTHGISGYLFHLAFIWTTVLTAIASLRWAKWLPNSGAFSKVGLLVLFVATTLIYGLQHGFSGMAGSDLAPTLTGLFGVAPLLLFGFLGFEAANGAAGEMKNPQKDVPRGLARSAVVAAACYLLPILAILLVIPKEKITGVSGLMEAVGEVFVVYGPAAPVMTTIAAALFVHVLVTQGAAWMIVSDRVQGIAAADGAFFGGFFGKFHRQLGTPIRINLLSGILASIFLVASLTLIEGSSAAIFGVVLTISISTYLISYLAIIPAAVKLRLSDAASHRPFRVPGGNRVFAALGLVCTLWVALGSWVAVFPGTLESLVGLEYPFIEIWGVDQQVYTAFTLGTLGVLAALGIAGYLAGRRLRDAAAVPDGGAPERQPVHD